MEFRRTAFAKLTDEGAMLIALADGEYSDVRDDPRFEATARIKNAAVLSRLAGEAPNPSVRDLAASRLKTLAATAELADAAEKSGRQPVADADPLRHSATSDPDIEVRRAALSKIADYLDRDLPGPGWRLFSISSNDVEKVAAISTNQAAVEDLAMNGPTSGCSRPH